MATLASLLVALVGCCRANYTFFPTYHSYVNPLHNRGDTWQCCDSQDMPPCQERSFCDNVFTLCVQRLGQPLPVAGDIQAEDCPLGFGVSMPFVNRDNIITFDTFVPVAFTGDIWPGSFQLVWQVFDIDDGNPDDFVDTLVVESFLSPSPSPTPPTPFTSSAGIFTLVISFRVECSGNLYGDGCDVFCEPQNSSSLGFYTCDSEGQRVCLPGYRDPVTNCTECDPATADCGSASSYSSSVTLSPTPSFSCTSPHTCGDTPETASVSSSVLGGIAAAVALLLVLLISSLVVVLVLLRLRGKRRPELVDNVAYNTHSQEVKTETAEAYETVDSSVVSTTNPAYATASVPTLSGKGDLGIAMSRNEAYIVSGILTSDNPAYSASTAYQPAPREGDVDVVTTSNEAYYSATSRKQ